ncbi:dynein regulatory complex subunit 3 isoform X1 [Poecilia latipinna]|uniref:dynein regulatory complex subunit 3 isoform X1 n=1 Tax=Poecilia latipinna TaxID=48699 RepID=UPI00072DF8F1|nr:PREDICTED: leucine-rich repeat-containing protein 48 isoform X1 [Poecilia latipinna]
MDSEASWTDDEYSLQEMLLGQHTSKEKYALHNYNLGCLDHREHIRLHLEFKNMVKMDFIHDFTSLTRLDLNNNVIQKIWGLDRLTNLTWLNLSFNKIENIGGLDSLRKLELLNLAFNNISVIKNMDTLENLTHFFISKNQIEDKECVHYLMRFKKLFKLSIGGNPFTEKDDQSLYVAAFIPNVILLDNILITPQMREEAAIKYKFELKKLLESQQAQEKIDKDAVVDSAVPVTSANKVEAASPDILPGAPPAQMSQSKLAELCSQIFPTDSDEYKQLETELNSFFAGQIETDAHYQQRASQILADFHEQYETRLKDIRAIEDPDLCRLKILDLRHETAKFFKNLLALEFEFVKNLDDNIMLLDSFISDMLSTGNDSPGQDEASETISDTENQMDTQVNDSKEALIKEIQEEEERRNRVRISDIYRYYEFLLKPVEEME